ncbi:unnamed protein product [Heligmosomoides polygyrus]|uniref:Uncharacterized protein n=1 Tax=Heligmosomoides polygyrus TaxID=6339 RepID=A0A3P8D0N1_HELPZ|nr:unnamed protein product [Heligmosomoides polygyrus]
MPVATLAIRIDFIVILPAILQAVQHQLDVQGAALQLLMEKLCAVLNRLFGTARTLFRRRFECFKVRYEGQDFNNYETMVKAKCTDAHFDSIDFDGLQCLFYVAGFQESEFADYRTQLLGKLDQAEKIALKDLTAECQLIKLYKDDARLLEAHLL